MRTPNKKGAARQGTPHKVSSTHDDSRMAFSMREVANVHPRFDTEEDGAQKPEGKVSVNARMIDTLHKNAESKSWSIRKWMEHLTVKSTSTIHSQPAWKALQVDKVGRKYFTTDEEHDLD